MRLPSTVERFFWEAPLVKVLVPFAFGIFLQLYFQFANLTIVALLICVLLLLYFVFQKFSVKNIFKFSYLNGLLIQLAILCFGIFITQLNDETNRQNYYQNFLSNANQIVVRLIENPIEKAGSYKALANVEQTGNQKSNGTTIIYFDKKTYAKNLTYGDVLKISNHFTAIKSSGNPGCFDYKFSCQLQGITHQVFLKENEYTKTGNRSNPFWKWLYSVHDSTLNCIANNIAGDKEAGIAEALLIGYRDNLDKDLQQVYANTGIVHVLAISGMHLVLIYELLNFILKIINRKKKFLFINSILVLVIIWWFALLTGLSGSVLRAAVMFTFLQAATLLNKKTSVYNLLCGSALLILICSPFTLADVGFQLSYIAVIGIISLQKYIRNWYLPSHWLIKKVWELIAVSLAAQLVTFPICIFYFHQFPNYFLLANLIAIPLSTAILYGEIGMIFLSSVKFNLFAKFTGLITTWLITLMNNGVEWVDSLRFSTVNGLQINPVQTVLIYIIIAFGIIWLVNKNANQLKISLAALLVFISWLVMDDWQINRQAKLVIYAIPHGSAIDFIDGKNYSSFTDSLVAQNHIVQNFHLKPARILFSENHLSKKFLSQKNETIFTFHQHKIIYIDKNNLAETLNNSASQADIIIVAHNALKSVNELKEKFSPKLLVFDSSNSTYKTKKIIAEAHQLGIKTWSTENDGALVMDF